MYDIVGRRNWYFALSALSAKYQLRRPTMSYIGQRSTW